MEGMTDPARAASASTGHPPPARANGPASFAASRPVPRWASQLAYAGLLPFVLGAALLWLVRPDAHPYVAAALSGYAAVIVSFLGGMVWGLAMGLPASRPARPFYFAWAVVPSLVAWVAVVLPPYAGLVVLGAMLVVCYLVDRRLYPELGASAWLTLRFRLSLVAALSCFVGAAGS
jgi:hypothetical protein